MLDCGRLGTLLVDRLHKLSSTFAATCSIFRADTNSEHLRCLSSQTSRDTQSLVLGCGSGCFLGDEANPAAVGPWRDSGPFRALVGMPTWLPRSLFAAHEHDQSETICLPRSVDEEGF